MQLSSVSAVYCASFHLMAHHSRLSWQGWVPLGKTHSGYALSACGAPGGHIYALRAVRITLDKKIRIEI